MGALPRYSTAARLFPTNIVHYLLLTDRQNDFVKPL